MIDSEIEPDPFVPRISFTLLIYKKTIQVDSSVQMDTSQF